MHRCCVLLVVSLCLVQMSMANMLTNASFENGSTADPGYRYENSGWFGWGGNRENWFARSGEWAAALEGWDMTASGHGGFGQQADTSSTGLYTFSVWLLTATDFNTNQTYLVAKLEWCDAGSNKVQSDTEVDLMYLPKDGLWHHVHVSGVATSENLHHVNPIVASGWSVAGPGIIYGDDADFYMGSYTGGQTELLNGGFEETAAGGWRGAKWVSVPGSNSYYCGAYESRTGSNSCHIWAGALVTGQSARLSQTLCSGTGTYVFSAWMLRETHFNLTNAQLRIEWYDSTFSNRIQADSVAQLNISNDYTWRQYAVTGTCVNPNLCEVRPVIYTGWDGTDAVSGVEFRIDDVTLTKEGASWDPNGDPDGDGMPNWWELLHFDGDTNATPTDDSDWDGEDNLREWIADTIPTNLNSCFQNSVTNLAGASIIVLRAGPPTSTSRVYDVFWKTNIMNTGDWTPFELDVAGNPDASEVTLIVTNDVEKRFYRTGVKLPGI